jgi:hypothetical protein
MGVEMPVSISIFLSPVKARDAPYSAATTVMSEERDKPLAGGDAGPPELDARGTTDLVGHRVLNSSDLDVTREPIHNVIIPSKTKRGAWIEESTRLIGPARARFRSTYFHWAMASNGLHVAAEKYSSLEWKATHQFTIDGARTSADGSVHKVPLAVWPGDKAAAAHLATAPKMMTWGYIELYAALEEFVFEIFRTYLNHHPDQLLRGDEFRDLRKLQRAADADPSRRGEWDTAWQARLEGWQRRKLYDSLHRVFLSYCQMTGLREPRDYTRTTVATWAETIEGIALVRHLLVHGEQTVTDELASFCAKPHSLSFGFKKDEPLRLDLHHLLAFECFADQLLNALNRSFSEHADAGA